MIWLWGRKIHQSLFDRVDYVIIYSPASIIFFTICRIQCTSGRHPCCRPSDQRRLSFFCNLLALSFSETATCSSPLSALHTTWPIRSVTCTLTRLSWPRCIFEAVMKCREVRCVRMRLAPVPAPNASQDSMRLRAGRDLFPTGTTEMLRRTMSSRHRASSHPPNMLRLQRTLFLQCFDSLPDLLMMLAQSEVAGLSSLGDVG